MLLRAFNDNVGLTINSDGIYLHIFRINNFEEINFFFQSNVAKIASNISSPFGLIYRFVLYCSGLEYPLIASSLDGHLFSYTFKPVKVFQKFVSLEANFGK